MSSDQSNTVVYMVPNEVLKAFEGFTKNPIPVINKK